MARELYYESSGSVPYMNVDRRVSWGAVIAGAITALAVLAALTMLGAGIGLVSAPSAQSGKPLLKGLGMGAGIWWFFTAIVAFYAGGWIAGRLAGHGRTSDSVIHGVLCWSVTTMLSLFMLTTAVETTLGGVSGVLGQGIAAGAAGLFGFFTLLVEGLAAMIGAGAGTRVVRVSIPETRRRETVTV